MQRIATLVGAAAVAFLASAAQAQKAKDFEGKWTRVPDPNASTMGGGRGGRGGLGAEFSLKVDDNKLTITRTTQAGETKSVYNLDGSDSKNTMTMGANSIDQVSKAMWMADTLMITTTMTMNGNPVQTSMSLVVDKSGQLVVNSTSPGRGGGAPTTTMAMYKKS